MDSKRIIKELGLKKFGVKGWLGSEHLICEQCGKSDKTGVLFLDGGGIFNCMRCGVKTSINIYLKSIGKEYLVERGGVSVNNKRALEGVLRDKKENDINTQLPEKRLPVGSKSINKEVKSYLDGRGFLEYHYDLFKPVVTNLDLRQKGSVIFQIFDKDNRRVAWLSRSLKSKDWHKENLRKHKESGSPVKLRYDNSPNTDFSYILGGINEVTEDTEVIILVEGLFDKVNTDKNLRLDLKQDCKCLFTFGDTIKQPQIDLIESFKNIHTIYLLYDYNTIENSKKYGLTLKEELNKNIYVCEIKSKDSDPGNLNYLELSKVLLESVDALVFKLNKLNHVS